MKIIPAKLYLSPISKPNVFGLGNQKPPRQLSVTSQSRPAPELIQCLCSNRFVQEAGWNSKNIARLLVSIQIVLRNFESLTGGKRIPEVVVSAQPPMEKGSIIEYSPDGQTHVFLRHDPDIITEYAPFGLAQRLTEMIFDPSLGLAILTSVSDKHLDKIYQYIESAANNLAEFYLIGREIILRKPDIKIRLLTLINDAINYLTTNKTAFHLLQPLPIPKRPIQTGIRGSIDFLRNQLDSTANLRAWEYLKFLAGFAVIAKKAGCPELEIDCFRTISSDFGIRLAALEQRQLHLAPVDHESAVEGFKLIFKMIRRIAEYYYDNLEIGKL